MPAEGIVSGAPLVFEIRTVRDALGEPPTTSPKTSWVTSAPRAADINWRVSSDSKDVC